MKQKRMQKEQLKAERTAAEYLAEMEAARQGDLSERRRRLANGVSRALLHLESWEMDAIEAAIYTAIGRSVVNK